MFKAKDLLPLAPRYHAWVDDLLRHHEGGAQGVASLGFPRLGQFFAKETYESARFVVVDELPQIPWAQLGLPVPVGMEGPFTGVTYRNTYFLVRSGAKEESVHCHEMVHVVQWHILGNDLFPLLYALEVFRNEYGGCFFEIVARQFQLVFDKREQVFPCETYVAITLGKYLP
ncbi:MAG: hypothetical protein MUP47_07275 [Phycisphaerae bacterium]|nr:hypothetical protein [Phycisphaerae bacterium]